MLGSALALAFGSLGSGLACMQAPWKPSGYLQDGPVGSSRMRAVVPTMFRESVMMTCVDVSNGRIFYFGGGLGLGVPVVSYAPRPMIMSVVVDSRVIIIVKDVKDWRRAVSI
jgi:hypothetical protein